MLSKFKQLNATLEKWLLALSLPQSSQMMLGKSLWTTFTGGHLQYVPHFWDFWLQTLVSDLQKCWAASAASVVTEHWSAPANCPLMLNSLKHEFLGILYWIQKISGYSVIESLCAFVCKAGIIKLSSHHNALTNIHSYCLHSIHML